MKTAQQCAVFLFNFSQTNTTPMKHKILTLLLLISTICLAQQNLNIIPKPNSVEIKKGHFVLNKETVIVADEDSFEAKYLQNEINNRTGLELKISSKYRSKNSIQFGIKIHDTTNFDREQYNIEVWKNKVHISAFSHQGIFYGIQTLVQMIPYEKSNEIKLNEISILDQPKFKWRGMHLDVCRHFFPKDFIKKYIDYLAMYKMNTFHWHLTDDQGWRIEIKKYHKLTEVGAWRNGSMIGHYTDQTFDDIRHGGFYTQDEIKEIVAYAKERHITIVPEIEMPGHALAALASYPEFSCTGGPFEVGKTWGVLEDVFCPKDETFTFLENVLTEVIALFPSEYIHIGGDESPKVRWKSCPHCQKRIKDENLKDEHELQSYFIQRIEKFLNSKGRKIIGWDEILEGGLAPNAAVMSWRGTEGGIAATKQKHFVVMSPGSHCYFDHYQGEPKNEPIAFGGYTNVEKVYSFNPIPKELSEEQSKYILGAQANLWTEYINTPGHVEYMLFPRIAALSEVVWGTSNPKEYKEFEKRLISHFEIYDKKGINYTTDGSEPNTNSISYEKPILVTKNQTIKAAYFENGKAKSAAIEQPFFITKSTGKKIELVHQPHENYGIGGSFTLVDGMKGNTSKIGINTLSSEGSWIYYPKSIGISVSNDGENYYSTAIVSSKEIKENKGKIVVKFDKQNVVKFHY